MALDVSGSSSLFWSTGLNNAGLLAGSTQAKGILAGLSKSITRMDVFAGLAIGSAIVFAKISKQAYNFSKEFETAMKEVETISKAVQNDFKGISQEIIDMSKTVPDSAKKLTKALYQIVSAGYDGAEAMKILRTSTELAVATVTDTFTAADALTYVMNAYGEAAGTAAEISDKLFTIIRLGKVKMEELGPTISMVTGLAAEAGLSFNELAAIYAEAVKKIQPHIVSTGIRGIITAMLRVSKGTGDAADKARELGIEFDISALRSKGFKQILSEIIVATKGNEAALMSLFPNVRGLIGLLAIMTDEGKGFNKTLYEIENSLGATGEAFKIMVDTTESQMAIMKNNIMAKLKPLGDSLLGQMNDIAKGINIVMSGATDEITRLSDTYSRLVDTLQRKKSRIDDLVNTIETLRNKTKLSREETVELEAAEKSLAVYYPNLVAALNGATHSLTILNEAKRDSLELTKKIAEVELVKAELEVKKANIELMKLERDEAEASKEVEKLAKKVEKINYQITRMMTNSMEMFLEEIKLYPFDDFTEEIERMIKLYKEEGIVVNNLGEKIKEIQEDLKLGLGEEAAEKQKELIDDVVSTALEGSDKYQDAMNSWGIATGELTIKEGELNNIIKEKNISIDAYREIIAKTKEELSKPIITPKPESKYGLAPETRPDVIIPTLTDEQIGEIEAKLKYMASRYKIYLSDVAQFGEEYVEEHNTQLAKDGENYGEYLDNMLEMYAENADLTKEIMDDIYEYNKGIIAKKKEAEEEFFNYLAELREKDLKTEKDNFEAVIKNYKEGSTEYLLAVEKHKEKEKAINLKYDKEIADAKLVIFRAGLEQQIGESDKVYKERYEKQLIAAKAEIGKETEINKIFFKFIHDELNKIAKAKEEQAKIDEATLASYLDNYRTTEEKIAAIHEETNKLIELTDDEATKNRLENIGKQKIAELEFADAMEKLNEELAGYKKDLDNKGLEGYIEFLEKMKIKYKDFTELVISLDEKIAESQKQIWEDIRNEIDQTANLLRNLADVVGNFDTELSQMINNMANLVSSIGTIVSGFATGNIFGIIGGIISGIGAIFNLFTVHQSDVPELEEQLHEITLELQEQQNILNQAIGTAKPEAIQNMIDLLNEQIDTYNEMIEAEEEAYAQFLWFTWSETDQQKIDQWLSSIQDINAEIANMNDQYNQILTGTTASAIANAIAEGFSQGLDSAQIFADTFNEMMKKSIMDAFERIILTKYIEDWYKLFSQLSGEGSLLLPGSVYGYIGGEWGVGLTPQEIGLLESTFQNMLEQAETEWAAFQAILEAAGINLFEETTIPDIIEQAEEAMEAIAGITEETIADAIAEGFGEGLNSAEVFADTFQDMMQRAIIDAFKKTIITQYLKSWYEQFNILSGGGFTVAEIETLAGVYENIINAASAQWEVMEAILEAAGIGLELEEEKRKGLTGAIAGITEETAGILAGQFQAIRINTVEILGNMESIIIINARIADNTEYNRYLESIDRKISEGNTLESEYLRSIGG